MTITNTSNTNACRPHSPELRKRLHADPALGCGNFLFKVLAEEVDRDGWLFELDADWVSPTGHAWRRLSLSNIEQAVTELAAWYRREGVLPGQVVLTYTAEGVSQFLHALALIALGAVPAPVNERMRTDVLLVYFRKYGFDRLVVDDHPRRDALLKAIQIDPAMQSCLLDALPKSATTDAGESLPLDNWPHRFDETDTLIMLCHSSGTTGVPKAVMFGHQQFFAGKRDRLLHFLERDDERMLSALPHSHSAGFSYLMSAVLLGLPTRVLSDPDGIGLARELLDFQPTIMAGFSQSYAALAEAGLAAGSVPALRRCFNTGDTAHETHVRALMQASPDLIFNDGFGASELGMALFRMVSSRASGVAGQRCVGAPVPFARARILDELGRSVPCGEVGYLAVKSPTITAGYFRDPSLTQRSRTPEGEWLTGDVGYMDVSGAFFHLDRAVDVIVTPRGLAYSLALEEAVLRECPVQDVTITGATLSPRMSQMVVAYLREPQDRQAACCEQVLHLLDGLLRQTLDGTVPICVVNWNPARPAALGATGKALKHVLRGDFWAELQAWQDGLPCTFALALTRHF